MFSWQMGTQSKQLWRSGGRGKMDAKVADWGPECFCHTSRASARRSAEYASHWVFTSRNTLRKSLTKVKGRPGMMEVKGMVYLIPYAECSTTYVGETWKTLRVHMAEHRRVVKNKDLKNGIAIHVQKTAHTINWQEAKFLGREDNWRRRRVLKLLWSNKGDQWWTWMLVWFCIHHGPLCLPRKWQSRDWKCYLRRSNPYLGRTSFRSTSTCWWQPPGLKHPSNAELSSTDCVSKCSWIRKD